MVQELSPTLHYPDSDGQPMADNTTQFRWLVTIKENLELCFVDNPDVFVAGDLLWYPDANQPHLRVAPDVMVVFGRPKGERGSYQQWREADIAPQVVFEILSPGNRFGEMLRKQAFYECHGVEEYYLYDPHTNDLTILLRQGQTLTLIDTPTDWLSPRLGVRFVYSETSLELYGPEGDRFLTYVELGQRYRQEQQRNKDLAAEVAALKAKLQGLEGSNGS